MSTTVSALLLCGAGPYGGRPGGATSEGEDDWAVEPTRPDVPGCLKPLSFLPQSLQRHCHVVAEVPR